MGLLSKKLRAFMTVAECGSVRDASHVLSLTVSPVSRLLNEFEHFYRQKLFVRNGKGLALTPQGQMLHKELAPLYNEMVKIERRIRHLDKRHKEITIYYDWGKDHEIYSLQKLLYSKLNYHQVTLRNIDLNDYEEGERLCSERIYLLSREHYATGYRLFDKISRQNLCLVSLAHQSDDNKTLVVCDEQMTNPVICQAVSKLKTSGTVNQVINLNSFSLMKEMLLNDGAVSIVPGNYCHLKTWQDFHFQSLDDVVGLSFDTLIYLPSGGKGNEALEAVLLGFTRTNKVNIPVE